MMYLARICSINDPAEREKASEDLVGWTKRACWVLDGASSTSTESHFETIRLVNTVASGILHEALAGQVDPRHLLRSGLARAAKIEFKKEVPSASGLVAVLDEGLLHYAILGDVTLVVVTGPKISIVNDPKSVERERKYLEEPAGLEQALQRVRRNMNKAGGYWIISDDPAAADHARTGSIGVERTTAILIASDGFARLVDLFGTTSWTDLTEMTILAEDLAPSVGKLRVMESEESSMSLYPRAKIHDDASAALFRIKTE